MERKGKASPEQLARLNARKKMRANQSEQQKRERLSRILKANLQ